MEDYNQYTSLNIIGLSRKKEDIVDLLNRGGYIK
jgi:hypothetical protein